MRDGRGDATYGESVGVDGDAVDTGDVSYRREGSTGHCQRSDGYHADAPGHVGVACDGPYDSRAGDCDAELMSEAVLTSVDGFVVDALSLEAALRHAGGIGGRGV